MKPPEPAQRAADVYLELAQALEAQAKRYRETAKYYRSGDLQVDYQHLPPDAGEHMRGPVQRAIDGLSLYTLAGEYERATAELKDYQEKGQKTRVDRAAARHRQTDPHCTCPDCIHHHATTLEE